MAKRVAKKLVPLRARVRLRRSLTPTRTKELTRTKEVVSSDDAKRLGREVSSLTRALWMGFTTDAVGDLERIRRAGDTPREPAARAAETLARWYTTNKNYNVALDRLIHARVLNGTSHPDRLRVLEHYLLTELGLFDEASQLFESAGPVSPDLNLMQANLRLRQAKAGDMSRTDADSDRLRLIDWVFQRKSLIPISELMNRGVLTFSSLEGTGRLQTNTAESATERRLDDPMVSIVVPAYNAESTLALSVSSLTSQSIQTIEILIVDDASTDGTNAVANQLAVKDPRISVLRHAENMGAYAARNTGLRNASGKYFTVHDADDWSHPQLLERQLEPLEQERAAGTFSRLARVSEDLEFILRPYRPMLEPIHWNYTCLLALTDTFRQFGGWDTVRAHADSELIERMRDYYGKDALVEVETEVPLSFFLVTGGNLTENRATSLRSVDFGARKEYTEQARFWRQKNFSDGEIPSYAKHLRTDAKAPFFCTRSLAQHRNGLSDSYDLVLGSDLSLQGGTRRCNLAYLDCALKLGLRVGVFNMPRYRLRGSGTIDRTYRELFQLDNVDLLTPEDDVATSTLLVHHPPVLRKSFDRYPRIEAAKHYLLVNQLPWEMRDYSSVQYETAAVRRNFEAAFGFEPIWIPISPRVRRYLEAELADRFLHHEDWYPIVNWEIAKAAKRMVDESREPVVGRHSRDHPTKWPEAREVLAKCYLAEGDYEVRLLGGANAAEKVLGYCPSNWVVHPFDSLTVEEFLTEIDFFIHFHHSSYIEEFGRNVAEAMAKGVPCILPPEYAETFRDAAVYAEPDDVGRAIRELWSDHDLYFEYADRGIAFVEKYSAPEVGMKRIESILE